MIHPVIEAFVDIHEHNGEAMTFNGIQNFLAETMYPLTDEDWYWAMWIAGELLPDAKVVNESDDFEQIEEALHRLSEVSLLNIIYVQTVLNHRGLWYAFVAWKKGEVQ